MSRRRMMIQNKVVNLFDEDSGAIIYNRRLSLDGSASGLSSGDEYNGKVFVSHFIEIYPGKNYVLKRKPIDISDKSYNRWVVYNLNKKLVEIGYSLIETNTITIPEDGYYIRFNGLITDIDNVKFYKV